jgi:hypothetical protein
MSESEPAGKSVPAENQEAFDVVSPTSENPHMYDRDSPIWSVKFSQVEGEILQGTTTGHYFAEDGTKINLVNPTRKSAEKAGWDKETQGAMHVPEWAVTGNESELPSKKEPLSDEVEAMADFTLEEVADIQDPAKIEVDTIDVMIPHSEIMRLKRERDAAARVLGEQIPVESVIPGLEEMMSGATAASPVESERAPKTLDQLTRKLSTDDKNHLKLYAIAYGGRKLSQKDGDEKKGRDDYERMSYHYKPLSSDAKALVADYVRLYMSSLL